jgi:hypothetical protein
MTEMNITLQFFERFGDEYEYGDTETGILEKQDDGTFIFKYELPHCSKPFIHRFNYFNKKKLKFYNNQSKNQGAKIISI